MLLISVPAMPAPDPIQEGDQSVVVDYAQLLTNAERAEVQMLLTEHNRIKFGMVRLIVLPRLPKNVPIEEFARATLLVDLAMPDARQDRVHLVIALEDRRLRIATSDLVQAVLSDEYCQEVVDNQLIPNFKKGEYVVGIRAGLAAILVKLEGGRVASAV